jgi:hypothetical protein
MDPYEVLGFSVFGFASIAAAAIVVNRRRPT